MPRETVHEPVLLNEVIQFLGPDASDGALKPGGGALGTGPALPVYLDCTLGGAGHASAMIDAFRGHVRVIGLDRDQEAIARAHRVLDGRADGLMLEKADYRNLDRVLDGLGIPSVDRMLVDLGLSSDELASSGKGFSFAKDEPLIMTFGDASEHQFTAADIVNGWSEEVLADIIFGYGEERFGRRIARAIVSYRTRKRIESSSELAEIVRGAVPSYYRRLSRIDPATKTFQALRIAVNDELNALREGLRKGYERLSPGGRMAVISFHSLEDRIVKNFFREKSQKGSFRKGGTDGKGGEAIVLTKKPVVASPEEVERNTRSRSAKLRAIEKSEAAS